MSRLLFNIGPGGPMESGIAAARHPESVELWHDGENVAFRNLGVEKAQGFLPKVLGRRVVRIAQAFVDGDRRAYYQDDQNRIWGWNGSGPPYYIGAVSGPARLEPWGSWLFVAKGALWVWKNEGTLEEVPNVPTVSVLLKNSKHLLGASGDTLSWADVRNPLDWTPSRGNTARSLQFRDVDGNIKALAPVSSGIAVYTEDSVRLVAYSGAGFWFGEKPQVLSGIGAVGPDAVVSAGFKNYGISRNGIFVTDGVSFQYIDAPAMHGYLEEHVDWSRADEIFGFHDEAFGQIVWTFPTAGGQRSLAYKYTNGGFTRYRLPIYAAADRDVFSRPLIGSNHGLCFHEGTAAAESFVRTKPLDAGDSLRFKFWDHVLFVGKLAGARLRAGVHDEVNGTPEWFYEGDLATVNYLYREGVFLTLEIQTDEAGTFEISQILAYGELTGKVR